MKITWLAAASTMALASVSQAQLIVGMDDTSGATNAWHVDVATGAATPLWAGVECWGLACDDASQIMYIASGSDLYSYPYSGGAPTLLGQAQGPTGSILFLGLAFGNGKLYGMQDSSPDVIWEVDPVTLVATQVYATTGSYNLGGFAFNPADGKFYGTSDSSSSPSGAGVYSIDVATGTETFITAYPAGVTDVDGCAVGNGKVWLVEDNPSPLHNFDLATMTYDPLPPSNPIPTSEVFSGAGWAPSFSGGPVASVYCTAKTNSLGCVPAIAFTGTPSVGATSGFTIDCSMVRNNKSGLLFYKVNGTQASTPFQGGTLCVGPSGIKRTPAQSAGGNPSPANDCSGFYSLDMNAFAAGLAGGNPDPALLTMGNLVHNQWWGRDQGFPAPMNTTLSDGLEFTTLP